MLFPLFLCSIYETFKSISPQNSQGSWTLLFIYLFIQTTSTYWNTHCNSMWQPLEHAWFNRCKQEPIESPAAFITVHRLRNIWRRTDHGQNFCWLKRCKTVRVSADPELALVRTIARVHHSEEIKDSSQYFVATWIRASQRTLMQ